MGALINIFVLGTLVLGVRSSEEENSTSSYTSLLPVMDAWWGPEDTKSNCDTSIRCFEIVYEEEMIADLKARLKNHRPFTPPLEGAAFQYGFNTDQMEQWIDYWTESYNFTERQAFLNQYPHYKTNIQGLDMHFIWIKPEVPDDVEVIPLLMLHGWPGSVREFYEAIPLITAYCEERGFAVELIVPSLPGFGFSGAAVRPGMGAAEMAVVLRNLMNRLGHEKFYIQGGDWGAHICNSIATQFQDEILGYHTNYAVSFAPNTFATWLMGAINEALQSLVVESSLADRLYPISTIFLGLLQESGYLHHLATKPDTVGVGWADSPCSLLANHVQIMSMASRTDFKFRDDGGICDLYSRDAIIDNIMIYWINNAATTAGRIYAESFNIRNVLMGLFAVLTPVPTCTVHAKSELIYQSPEMLKFKFTNLLNSTVLEDYGHFLALEKPELFSESVLDALTAFRSWHEKKNNCNDEL